MECALDRAKQVGTSVTAPTKLHYPFTRNPPKRKRRGGACVPARTSAQRRFHTKNTRIVCGDFNDECALVGRRGRAHRHRPYPSPSYFSTQPHTHKITICAQSTPTASNTHTQSSQTKSTTQTKRVNNLHHNNRGRKCIAHSRPLNSK